MERGLSIGEKKMLSTAKNILISEMVLAENVDKDALDMKIEETIKNSYNAGNIDGNNNDMVIAKVNLN